MARWSLLPVCIVATIALGCSGAEAARELKQGRADRKLLWNTAIFADGQRFSRDLLAPGAEPKEPKEPKDAKANDEKGFFERLGKFAIKRGGGGDDASTGGGEKDTATDSEGGEGDRRRLMEAAQPKEPAEPKGAREVDEKVAFVRVDKFSKRDGDDGKDAASEGNDGGDDRRHLLQN